MPATSPFSDAEWAQQLTDERARREQAEAELAQTRARLAALEQPPAALFHTLRTQIGALVHNLRLGVVLVDASGQVKYVSPHFWCLFGLEPVTGSLPFAENQLPIAAAFADPDAFHARAWTLHAAGKTVLGEAFLLRDGRRLVLDYLVLDEAGAGRFICYRDVTRPHRREQRLRMLAAMPEQNPNPILRLNPSGEVLYANPAAAPLVEALRTAAAEVLPPLLALVRAVQQGTAPARQELIVAGQYYLVKAALVPWGADTMLYFTNITDRRLAENLQHKVQDMLREQEAFIRQIVDALPNGIHLIEPGGNISFSNRAFDELFNDSAHLTAAEPKSEVVAREIADMRAFSQEVMRTGQPDTREMPLTLNTGEQLYYQVYKQPLRRANGQVGVLNISTDVTAVKRARQELERREKQYYDLVHYSQALICTHDLQGILLSVNPAIERLLGWPVAELVGRSLGDFLPPAHLPDFQAYLEDLQTVHPQDRYMTILTRTGNLRYLRNSSYLVVEAGCPSYVVASGYDVTAGMLAQRALEQAKREAEDNTLAKETFLARMSHEIRTPLNGVLGMATLLQKTSLTAAQQEYLTTMQVAGRHLLTLVNDVLDMAKITTHHLELEHLPFDLRLVLEGTGQTVAALAAQNGLELVVRPPTMGYRLVGDAYRLRQVLLNLLSNALKFTERGQIEIGAEVLDESLAAAPGAVMLHFWVADTGVGMSLAEQAHIFEAFAQASTDTSRRYGGTGLGLAISQQLVEQMGGLLKVRSAPGEGTTFSFVLLLPRDEAPPEVAPDSLPVATYEALRGLRVLLAEDNIVNQQIAKAVLEYWGVQVQAVSNGLDALAELRNNAFDAALLDIRMPGLSGVEVTTAIRMHPDFERATIPIVALTANAFENDRIAYIAAGMNVCLTKPYEEAALCQLLLDLTNK